MFHFNIRVLLVNKELDWAKILFDKNYRTSITP